MRVTSRAHGVAAPDPPHEAASGLNQRLANAVVRCFREYAGRGPTEARAFYRHNIVVVVLQDALTTAERQLVAHGRGDAVLELRRYPQELMRGDIVAAVERLTGRSVDAFLSASHLDPDIASEVFVLDGPIDGGAAGDSVDVAGAG
jgi:uncharacterized protein YbcI